MVPALGGSQPDNCRILSFSLTSSVRWGGSNTNITNTIYYYYTNINTNRLILVII